MEAVLALIGQVTGRQSCPQSQPTAQASCGPPHAASWPAIDTVMNELFAGIAGGLGLFIAGMWLLTENLKTLASRRLRRSARRWTTNRFSALLWGVLAGGITQSMTALTFIVVSILRSGLIATRGALALILGGCVGASFLVVIVTFDIKVVALYVLGLSGAVMASERLSRYRPIAASFLGGAMLILGLVLLKDAAAPLAQQPWFRDMLEGTGKSLALAFVVAAFLTAILQSANAVCVFGIGLASVGVISVDQAKDAAAPLAQQPWFRDMLEGTGKSLESVWRPSESSPSTRRSWSSMGPASVRARSSICCRPVSRVDPARSPCTWCSTTCWSA